MITLDLSLENLYRHYRRCRRNKRNTVNALRFEADQERELLALRDALQDRSYQPSRSVCFVTTRPKAREIFAAEFRDRVVHHLLVDYLERIWEPVFIHDSYACRRGKGVHRAVARLTEFLRGATANGTRAAWYLQLDVRNYFMRIDKAILFQQLAARIRDDAALWLTRLLVFHDCTTDYVLRGEAAQYAHLPPHKTLFHASPGKGLSIGNLNSQFFANVRAAWRLDRRYHVACPPRRARDQYRLFRARFPGDALFFQVGRFYEIYEAPAPAWATALHLQPARRNRRGMRYGFPLAQRNRCLRAVLDAGWPVTEIHEGKRQDLTPFSAGMSRGFRSP